MLCISRALELRIGLRVELQAEFRAELLRPPYALRALFTAWLIHCMANSLRGQSSCRGFSRAFSRTFSKAFSRAFSRASCRASIEPRVGVQGADVRRVINRRDVCKDDRMGNCMGG